MSVCVCVSRWSLDRAILGMGEIEWHGMVWSVACAIVYIVVTYYNVMSYACPFVADNITFGGRAYSDGCHVLSLGSPCFAHFPPGFVKRPAMYFTGLYSNYPLPLAPWIARGVPSKFLAFCPSLGVRWTGLERL